MFELQKYLKEKISKGEKLLAIYITAGISPNWLNLAELAMSAGADLIEVGIPFSDPMIDGPIIQKASQIALREGMTPLRALTEIKSLSSVAKLVIMTYFNPLFRIGLERVGSIASDNDILGFIVPDLSFEESARFRSILEKRSLCLIDLVAPSTTSARLKQISQLARGFVYVISTMGVTGERKTLDEKSMDLLYKVKESFDIPALLGIGVSNVEQARQACKVADGVIIGSRFIRMILEGEDEKKIYDLVKEIKGAINNDTPGY